MSGAELTVGEFMDELVKRGFIVLPFTANDYAKSVALLSWLAERMEK